VFCLGLGGLTPGRIYSWGEMPQENPGPAWITCAAERRLAHVRRRRPPHLRDLTVRSISPRSLLCHPRDSPFVCRSAPHTPEDGRPTPPCGRKEMAESAPIEGTVTRNASFPEFRPGGASAAFGGIRSTKGTLNGSQKKEVGGLAIFWRSSPDLVVPACPAALDPRGAASSRPRRSCWAGSRPPKTTHSASGAVAGWEEVAPETYVLGAHKQCSRGVAWASVETPVPQRPSR